MASVSDAAKALIATAGSEEAATAAAHELAAYCTESGELAEAAFWRAVADTVVWECNPQPLIAPDIGGDQRKSPPARRAGQRASLALPTHRSTVLGFKRDIRDLWKQYGPPGAETPKPKKDDPEP